MPAPAARPKPFRYSNFLLLVAGLGGLLYGVDVGIIGGALPYLEATSRMTAAQLSIIVAAVLLGSVLSTLVAGLLADWMGRKPLMTLSGIAFVASIPVIALSHGYGPLFFGRLLQGVSGGLVGVVVPLYLAECLPASNRGKGTGIFQWLLTLGIVLAAVIGIYYSYRVAAVTRTADAAAIFLFKDQAWRRIFWVSMPPGLLFVVGSFFLAESPRWLFLHGRREQARASLLRSGTPEMADASMREMEHASAAKRQPAARSQARDSLLRRKYVVPFLLACAILVLNQTTGINSIIAYNTGILLQSGLSDLAAHWGYVVFTVVQFFAAFIGVSMVDRKGRKFLFLLGTAGVVASLVAVALLFLQAEGRGVDCTRSMQAMARADQTLTLQFDPSVARTLMAARPASPHRILADRASLEIIYSYGGFTAATNFARSDDAGAAPIEISRSGAVPSGKFEALLKNPFADIDAARTAPLKIQRAYLRQVPGAVHGWLVALGLYGFIAFFAFGPSVCVWLALSELMPTRIRSNGMSIALVLNQAVSTLLAGVFLPVVSQYGYSTIFFLFAGCTVFYFLTVAFFLPETKGKTLEEIEEHFERAGRAAQSAG